MKTKKIFEYAFGILAIASSSMAFSETIIFQCLVTGSTTLETVQGNGRQLSGIHGSFQKGDFVDLRLSPAGDSKTLQLEIRFKEIPEYFFESVSFKQQDNQTQEPRNESPLGTSGPTALIASSAQGYLSLNQYYRNDWHGLIMARESWTDSEIGLMATINCFDAGIVITDFYQSIVKSSE